MREKRGEKQFDNERVVDGGQNAAFVIDVIDLLQTDDIVLGENLDGEVAAEPTGPVDQAGEEDTAEGTRAEGVEDVEIREAEERLAHEVRREAELADRLGLLPLRLLASGDLGLAPDPRA